MWTPDSQWSIKLLHIFLKKRNILDTEEKKKNIVNNT